MEILETPVAETCKGVLNAAMSLAAASCPYLAGSGLCKLLSAVLHVLKADPEVRTTASDILVGCARISVDQVFHNQVYGTLASLSQVLLEDGNLLVFDQAVRAFATFARVSSYTQLQSFLPASRRTAVVAFLKRLVPTQNKSQIELLQQEMQYLLQTHLSFPAQSIQHRSIESEQNPAVQGSDMPSALEAALQHFRVAWKAVERCLEQSPQHQETVRRTVKELLGTLSL